jgi:hypothetical protein
MITNILDRRTAVHRWARIDAVAEATWHDNMGKPKPGHDNADAAASIKLGDTFEVRSLISVAEAIAWASTFPDEVTLYLYDEGSWGGARRPDTRRSDQAGA